MGRRKPAEKSEEKKEVAPKAVSESVKKELPQDQQDLNSHPKFAKYKQETK